MGKETDLNVNPEEFWRHYMMTGVPPQWLNPPWYRRKFAEPLLRHLPSEPRCRICHYPFEGVGGRVMRVLGIVPSQMNPKLCNLCEWAAEHFPGGAEIEATVLFADVRGSTALAENLNVVEYSRLINRFYGLATAALIHTDGMVEKLAGDEVAGFYVPGFAGPHHAHAAIHAAQQILRATGHGSPDGPWLPVGICIHSGPTYIGNVHAESGVFDITILGDSANVGARLASQAGRGEILVSEAARACAKLEKSNLELRRLQLKGRTEPVETWVLHA